MDNNQQFFQTILNHTSDVLMIVDRNRHIIFITPNVYESLGYRPEELHNRDGFDILHPEDKENMLQRHHNLLTSKQSNTSEYRMIRKNGEVRYGECKTTPLPDTENYLQVVSIRDITERKRMELELEYHKNRHEVLQNSLKNFSNDLSFVMKHADLEERLIKELITILPNSNPTIMKIFPKNINLSLGKMETVSDKVLIKIGERQQSPYILSIKSSAIREQMESIWLETLAYYSMMVFENLNMIENLIQQLETATRSKETPQWVLRLMFNLQEQQRLTLSSDLHDTVLQDQIDLYRRLESLLNRYEIDKEVKTKLVGIEQGLLDIIHDIRATCNNLRPPLLRELGLKRSLENLFEHVQISSTYKITFTSEDLSMLPLSEEQTIGIYRIVQELLNHAEEHSRANEIKFDLYYEDHQLKLVYSDDGVGQSSSSDHLRLTNVEQRAQSLGGKMDISLEPRCGLLAALQLPINLERSLV
ncbi:PAS domain-containing sensor histidine kinase [Neobacillus sp. SAB-20_R2A]|uniref:PAS domain-containing sensor histidine kinase n=1 Tax=Neobacillus sp. SAB-20_R2A TaxID=3120519 RepID=UPI003C6E9E7F